MNHGIILCDSKRLVDRNLRQSFVIGLPSSVFYTDIRIVWNLLFLLLNFGLFQVSNALINKLELTTKISCFKLYSLHRTLKQIIYFLTHQSLDGRCFKFYFMRLKLRSSSVNLKKKKCSKNSITKKDLEHKTNKKISD